MRQVNFAPGPNRRAHPSLVLSDSPGAGLLAATVALLLAGAAARADDQPPPAGPPGSKSPAAGHLSDIVVTGESYSSSSLSLEKYGEPLLTTGQTATVVTAGLMQDEGISSLRDSLRNVAGISIGAGEGSYQGDNFSIRGFAARSDLYMDGMSDTGNYTRDPFNVEEVEVLKGPSSAEFGRGAAGGVVNLESKSPRRDGFAVFAMQGGVDATRRATIDVDMPLDVLPSAALRVNAMVHKSEITDRPGPYNSRWGVAPSLAIGLDTPTRLTLSYFFQHQNDLPDFGLPWILDRPAPVARSNYYGFTDGQNFFRTDINIGTVTLEHDFSDALTVREQLRIANYHREMRISQGDPPDEIDPSTLSTLQIDRTQIDGISTDRAVDQDLSLIARFATGSLHHTLVAGVEYLHQSVDPTRTEPCWQGITQTSLFNPTPADPFTGVSVGTCTAVSARVDNLSASVVDTMKLGPSWTFVLAARVDRVSSEYYSFSPDIVAQYGGVPGVFAFSADNHLPSFRAAIVYQPSPNGSVYLSSGTSVHPNAQQVSISSESTLTPDFAALAVGRNVEVELGTKWLLANKRLTLNMAVFWDQQRNPAPVDADDPLIYVSNGRERVQGLEFSVAGALTKDWQIALSYTYQDGIVTGSSDPTLIGNQVLNSPRNSTSLWTTYQLTPAWQVGFGANQVSTRVAAESADPVNGLIQEAPGYVIGSAMMKYRMSKQLEVQANLNNLTDKYYYDGVHPGHVVPGAGRTLYVGAVYRL